MSWYWPFRSSKGLEDEGTRLEDGRVVRLKGSRLEQRLSSGDWAEMFSFAGNAYPIGGYASPNLGSKTEAISNDYLGYVNGAYKSSGIVFACMAARMRIFSEGRFQYQKLNAGRPGDLFGMPDLAVLETPWPNGTTGDLLARAIQSVDLSGNFYVVREGSGPSSRLRWLRPDWTDIILTAPPDEAVRSDVAGYVFRPGDTRDSTLWEIYPIDGSNGIVAHWSPIPDPEAQYRGMSWITPVLRDILVDKGATANKNAFFDNACVPALAVSFKETVTPAQFQEFKAIMDAKGGTAHAYETLYLAGGADVTIVGTKLDQIDFQKIQGHVETRICMAAGIHPVIVGVSEGFRGTPLTSDNLHAARDLFADGTMWPMWRTMCAAFAPLVTQLRGARLWIDTRDIPFLRQDHTELAVIRQTEASTLSTFITAGFTPDSAIQAILHGDIGLLDHTGMYSVQLQPPGTGDANTPDPADAGSKQPQGPAEGEG